MKSVSEQVWQEKAQNFQDRITKNPYPKNLDHYRKIVDLVTVGDSVLDVGAGNCYVDEVLPEDVWYYAIDPFPRLQKVKKMTAENLNNSCDNVDTVICLAALDNVQDVELALKGMLRVARLNIVILTGIGIDVDSLHTHRIERKDLTDVLGEPKQEIEISPKVFLFEFFV